MVEVRADRWPPAQRCNYYRKDGTRCKAWAVRTGRWCRFHQLDKRYYANRKREAEEIQAMSKLVQVASPVGNLELARRSLAESAPDAVALLHSVVLDESAPAGVRVKAAEVLLKAAGVTPEPPTVVVDGRAQVDVIRERLDRLRDSAMALPSNAE